LLAVNIAMLSLMMPIVVPSQSFAVFVAARALLTFALNGEWSLGLMLVAETRPAHLRGRVISINRPPGASAPRLPARSPVSSPGLGDGARR
jgi:MFS family permease